MTCADRERELALYAGGDAVDPDIEQHLEHCPGCRGYVAEMRGLLAELSDDDVPAAPPIAAAVMRRVRGQRYRWAALAATAAAASVLVAVVVSMLSRPLATMTYALRAPQPPAIALSKPAAVVAKSRLVQRVRHRKPSQPAEPMVVKLVTDDPNVVIYWITD